MKKEVKHVLIWVFAILLIVIYAYTGFSKLLNSNIFEVQLRQSPIIPALLIPVIKFGLPFFEILICLLLISDKFKRLGFYISLHVFVFFTSYLGVIVMFFDPLRIPCACGGIIGELSYTGHIALNTAFVFISLAGYKMSTIVDSRIVITN